MGGEPKAAAGFSIYLNRKAAIVHSWKYRKGHSVTGRIGLWKQLIHTKYSCSSGTTHSIVAVDRHGFIRS